MSADDAWKAAFERGAARASSRTYAVEDRKRGRVELTHQEMRATLKAATTAAVAELDALRGQRREHGHFINNVFVPAGVSRRDVALAFQQPEGVKKR